MHMFYCGARTRTINFTLTRDVPKQFTIQPHCHDVITYIYVCFMYCAVGHRVLHTNIKILYYPAYTYKLVPLLCAFARKKNHRRRKMYYPRALIDHSLDAPHI